MDRELIIFKSLFKGREDVFAIHWEREGKSGYMPACDLDWNKFVEHKAKGGTFKDFPEKQYTPLTNDRIINHLNGKEIIGFYPLLQNNTSWFIAADFDQSVSKKKSWIDDCRSFIAQCERYYLPVYLERSRSGTGGHVWMFFEEPYPAYKSRRIFLHLLHSSGIISEFDKDSNFDRLFPNQDCHSGKGLGNLIALPLQKKALENDNACFINPESLEKFPHQFQFLMQVQKISSSRLDELYNSIHKEKQSNSEYSTNKNHDANEKLQITLDNKISLSRTGLTNLLIRYLRDNLNFINIHYFIKKNSGRNTYNTKSYFKTLDESNDNIVMPRGLIGKLLRYCKEQNILYHFEDKRVKLEPVKLACSVSLFDYQQRVVEATDKKDFGVIVAPPGSGKTMMGLAIVTMKQQPALIIVHRKQLFEQWVERIESFLKIPKFRIGKIEGGKCDLGEEITVAMIQSLQSENLPENIYKAFGLIIVDECHHIPAKTFREAISPFHSYYLYGFTATPFRKNKDEQLIFIHIGEIIHEVVTPVIRNQSKQLSITIKETNLSVPFNVTTDKVETLLHILIHDTARNELIVKDIKRERVAGRKILVLTERKAHVEILQQYLKDTCETIILTGDDNEQKRKSKLQQIEEGDFDILIATGQLIGEGTDFGILNCLILAYPFSFEGKLVQYIGRVQRSEHAPVIYDYRDSKIEYLENLFKQRNKYYRKLASAGQLTKPDELILVFNGAQFYINTTEPLFTIYCLDLPIPVEEFKQDTAWKIRVIDYNEETGELFTEIMDYNFPLSDITDKQTSFYFYGIEKIRFRNIDTTGFLKSVILKKQIVSESETPVQTVNKNSSPQEHVFLRTMKVPFSRVQFLNGSVSFPVFIEAVNQEIVFEIQNPDIRPEFEAIRQYFIKALKKKLITVEITVRYTNDKIPLASARSKDIDSINTDMIDSMRFEFIKREILKEKPLMDNKPIYTLDDLLNQNKNGKKLFSSETDFVDDLLKVKKSKHYLQLKYLSSKHESSVLKLRFVLQPFSFLFLLSGERKYHVVWETLDREEATYIWHIEKTREALRNALNEIECAINEIKQRGRQNFLQKGQLNFSRIVHDYTNPEKGFIAWKGVLEERII